MRKELNRDELHQSDFSEYHNLFILIIDDDDDDYLQKPDDVHNIRYIS